MQYTVEVREVAEQPIAAVRGRAITANLPATIRKLFDQFYAGFKGKGGLNIVLYNDPGVAGEFEIACDVHIDRDGNKRSTDGLAKTASGSPDHHGKSTDTGAMTR